MSTAWREEGGRARILLLALAAATQACSADSGGPSGGGPNDGGQVPSELDVPATLGVVSVPDVDPAWPIGDWSSEPLNPSVPIVCTDGPSGTQDVTYDFVASAGAGPGTHLTTMLATPIPLCAWDGTPSADGRSITAQNVTCPYTTFDGHSGTLTLDRIAVRLVNESAIGFDARVYAAGTLDAATKCNFTLDHFAAHSGRQQESAVLGHHDQTLDPPAVLRGWGQFPVDAGGASGTDASTFRHVLAVQPQTPLPAALALDGSAYAVELAQGAISFQVLQAVINSSARPICLNGGSVSTVTNSAGVPVTDASIDTGLAAPLVGLTPCLRPGERAWIYATILVPPGGPGTFADATIAVITSPTVSDLMPIKVAASPIALRAIANAGLEVDFVGAPATAQGILLDADALPVGRISSALRFAPTALRPAVCTVSFPPQPTLGTPASIVVFPGN